MVEPVKVENQIKSLIDDHQATVKKLYSLIDEISAIAGMVTNGLSKGNKILLMGNGGSAADSQHIAAELVGRFQAERKAFPAIALTTDTSVITSVSNDYNYKMVFKRQVEALCNPGDVVIGISTSGNSKNIILALEKAKEIGAVTIGFSGKNEAAIDQVTNKCLKIPEGNTARIQEMHILCGHILCEIVEQSVLENQ